MILQRLVLADFRSYASLDLAIASKIVVVGGDNGSGKTNLVEAISMFAQGRGLRRADLGDCVRRGGGGGFRGLARARDARRDDPARHRTRGGRPTTARRNAAIASTASPPPPHARSPTICASSG